MGQITATPNQSYLVKNMQFRMAAALAILLQDLGFNVANHWSAYKDNPTKSIFYPTGWRKDRQDFDVRPSGDRKASTVRIWFANPRWDSGQSDIHYGPKTIDHKAIETDSGKTQIVKNGTDGELHVSYEKGVSQTNSFSSSVTKGVSLDMTTEKDASVDATETVSGEYAGVSAEVSLAEHLGVSESKTKSQSSELGKEKSEEGSTTETLAIEFDAKPRSNYLVSVTKENEQTRQPFDIDGVMDFDIHVAPQNRYWQGTSHHGYRPHNDIRLTGVEGLAQFLAGFDTNYPSMEHYLAHAPEQVRNAMDWIQNPENRRIRVSGINQASLDSNADYEVKLLGASVPPELAHLPEVDAQDVSN